MAGATVVTMENYDEVLCSPVPVLIDFYAPWCGHCQELLPTVEKLAEEVGQRAKICKLNVDECREKAMAFSIRSIPTLILFMDGKEVARLTGNKSREDILAAIEKASS